jgi:cellobiose dehydrogenase (acceptor)
MTGKLITVFWPSGNSITHSIRLARTKNNPPEYTGGAKIVQIKEGTYTNGTHWTATFLCRGCITGSSLSFGAGDSNARLGWGISTQAVRNAASSNARLGMHAAGTGLFSMRLASAKSEKFSNWASKAN